MHVMDSHLFSKSNCYVLNKLSDTVVSVQETEISTSATAPVKKSLLR